MHQVCALGANAQGKHPSKATKHDDVKFRLRDLYTVGWRQYQSVLMLCSFPAK